MGTGRRRPARGGLPWALLFRDYYSPASAEWMDALQHTHSSFAAANGGSPPARKDVTAQGGSWAKHEQSGFADAFQCKKRLGRIDGMVTSLQYAIITTAIRTRSTEGGRKKH